MDYILNDLIDRVDMLENLVYQLKKDCLNMPFSQFVKQDLTQTFTISGANSFEIGSLSGVGSAEIYILCKISCSVETEVFVDIGNSVECSKKVASNSQNSICTFAIKTSDIGSVKLRIENSSITGSISEISVIVSKNATFSSVFA